MERNKTSQSSLAELQRWMRWVITDPRGVAEALKDPRPSFPDPFARYTEPKKSCSESIEEQPPLSRIERLDIYAEAYFARILEALEKDFPTLKRILGEELFPKIISDYLKRFPSKRTNIGEIGKSLSVFLKDYPVTERIPYVAETAQLEWAIAESFYAPRLPPLDTSILSTVAPERWGGAKFGVDPSIKLLMASCAIEKLWWAKDEDTFEKVEEELFPAPTFLFLNRPFDDVHLEVIGESQFRILNSMQANLSLEEICFLLEDSQSADSALEIVQQCFGAWVGNGVIRKIYFPKMESCEC